MTRTERTYYPIAGGYNLAQFFLAPVYPIFLLSRGLDLFQVNATLAVYLLTAFALDIPTGAIADRFGRKPSFALACAVRAAAFTLYYFTRSFADCLVAEVIDAVGTTLASGALEAWAVDGIRAEGDAAPLDRMFARIEMITRGAMIAGGIVCGYVGQASLGAPWLVAAGLFAATGVAGAIWMREVRTIPAVRTPVGKTAAAAIVAVRTTPTLLAVCVLTLLGAFAMFPVWQLWQARMAALSGEGPWLLGWVVAACNLGALVGGAAVPRVLRRADRGTALAASSIWRGAMLGVAAASTTARPLVAGLVLEGCGAGLAAPVFMAWINEHVPPAQRATVLSVRSTFFTLGGACGLVVLGLVARADGIPAAWAIAAALLVASVPGYVALGRLAGGRPVPVVPSA